MTHGAADAQLNLRSGSPADAEPCGQILFDAFATIAAEHNFPSDVPSVEVGIDLIRMLFSHPHFFSVVAELDGTIVGSNVLDERSQIAGLGPITVDPKVQNRQIGRRLMEAALERAQEKSYPGVPIVG